MAFTHRITRSIVTSGNSLTGATVVSADGQQSVAVAVNDSVSDLEIEFDVLIADLKSIFILATQDMTLKTNSSGAPPETLDLLAGKPYVWHEGSYFANLLATDITKFFVTNASGADGQLDVEALYDATP